MIFLGKAENNRVDRCGGKRRLTKRFSFKSLALYLLLITLTSSLMFSCGSSRRLMTEDLFMQYKRVSLNHVDDDMESQDAGRVLHEQGNEPSIYDVEDTIASDGNSLEHEKLDTNKVYNIQQVIVTTKARFSPVKDGYIDVDFLVHIPQEILSENWQLTLQPMMQINDSIAALEELVFKGQEFAKMQTEDYAEFDAFTASIVDVEDYDKYFLDRDLIDREIAKRQKLFYSMYSSEWAKLRSYKNWKNKMEDRYNFFNIKADTRQRELYSKLNREHRFQSRYMTAVGQDTANLYNPVREKFDRKTSRSQKYRSDRQITERSVPKKYRHLYLSGATFEDIKGNAVNEGDSTEIAELSYLYGKIAENEFKMDNEDDIFTQMVPYAYATGVRADSVIASDRDFVYQYRQSCPITPGLQNVRVTATGYVNAIDRSGYTMPPMDTLVFVISSLDQLVDTTLITKRTTLHRNMFDRVTISPEYEDLDRFNPNLADNFEMIDSLVRHYETIESMGLNIDSIDLINYTGLAGTFHMNALKSTNRLINIKDYMGSEYSSRIDVESKVVLTPRGEDWNGLVRLIRRDNKVENAEKIVDMMRNADNPDETKDDIKEAFPIDYKYIEENLYPELEKIEAMYHISRPNMESQDSLVLEFRSDYAEGVRLLQERRYWDAIEFLANYPDYNAALNLLCLNQDQRAYDLLEQLKPTGGIHYLMAIAGYRLGMNEEAAEHLVEACRLDPSKVYRAQRDYEPQQLINEFDLFDRMKEASDESYNNLVNSHSAQNDKVEEGSPADESESGSPDDLEESSIDESGESNESSESDVEQEE